MIDYKQQPPVKPFGDFSIDIPEPRLLDNGTALYVVPGSDQEVCRIDVIHRGGIFEEMPHKLVAQSMVSQLSQGTASMSSQEIAECIDYNGVSIGSSATFNHTAISLHSLNRCFDNVLPVLHDMVFAPLFPERELQVYRNRNLGAYRTARQRVRYMGQVEMRRIFFGDDYPTASAVSDDDIMAIDAALLQDFHRRYYHAANRTVILSGGITDREIGMVVDTFGRDCDGRDVDPYVIVPQKLGTTHFSFVEKNDAVQSAVLMQLPAVKRGHPDYFNLRILVTALGGYFGSRLMSNVREDKGYTYGIGSALIGTRTGGYVVISTECDCAYTRPLIDEVRHEMARLRQDPIPQSELDMVKSNMLSDLVKNLDTPFAMAENVSSVELYGIYPQYFNEQIRAVRAVTPEALQDVACRYLTDEQLYTVVAGRME